MFIPNKYVVMLSAVGTCIGGAIFLKDYSGGRKFSEAVRADGKVVVVTGANCGIGKETARELARRGARVYLACRDMQRCEDARAEIVLDTGNKFVYCRPCDLASQQSIRNFAENFKKEEGLLHVLVNNAGVMRCPRSLTAEGVELQLGVNHLGHFLLTSLLLEPLKAGRPSRVVVVSSVAHVRGNINKADLNSQRSYDEGAAYNQSKLANLLFSRELARRLQGSGVTVNALHPGIVDTEIIRHMSFFNSSFSSLFLRPLVWPFVKSPAQGAQTSLFVALSPSLEATSGKYFSNCQEVSPSEQAQDDQLAGWLWAVSERWTASPQTSQAK